MQDELNYSDNKPEEQGSTAQDFGHNEQEEDQETFPLEWENVDSKCPECGSVRMRRCAVANGRDDYRFEYECVECGATFEE